MKWVSGYTGLNSPGLPSIVAYHGMLHLFAREQNGWRMLHAVSPDGVNWPRQDYIDFDASSGACPVEFGGQLHVFYQDRASETIMHACSDDGYVFRAHNPSSFGQESNGNIYSAAALNNTLVVISGRSQSGVNDAMQYALHVAPGSGADPEPWTWATGDVGMNTSGSPGVVASGGAFQLFFRDGAGNGLCHVYSLDGVSWQSPQPGYIGFNGDSGPSAAVFNNQMQLFYKDDGGRGLMRIVANLSGENSRGYPTFFQDAPWYLYVLTQERPCAAVFQDKLCVVSQDDQGEGIMLAVGTADSAEELAAIGGHTLQRVRS